MLAEAVGELPIAAGIESGQLSLGKCPGRQAEAALNP